ncbi:MAG: SLOG family protein, partial [Candidatus Pararuminococcus gallinarum]
ASPYEGFESRWSEDWKVRYNAVMEQADLVRYVCKGYSRACFQIRNEWMVDRAARVIAVYNGEPGGTRNTIEYANKNKVECFKI